MVPARYSSTLTSRLGAATALALCLAACSDSASGDSEPDGSGDASTDTSDLSGDATDLTDTTDLADSSDGGAGDLTDASDLADDGAGSDLGTDTDGGTDDSGGDALTDASDESTLDVALDVEADQADSGLCNYLDIDVVLLTCGEELDIVSHLSDLNGDTVNCPDFWTFGPPAQYESLEEAATARGCTTDCQYRQSSAVMFLHCGFRNEYISWAAPGEACPTLLQFVDGEFYEGIADYREANPCPCGANQALLEWPTTGYVIDFTVEGDNGYVWVTGDDAVAHVASFVDGELTELGDPSGPTEANDDEYNPGYSFRLVPDDVTFAGEPAETCNVTPCYVEDNWPDWLETPNTWCPSTFEEQAIYDCSEGDGSFCDQVWP